MYYICFVALHHLDHNLKHYSGAEMNCAFSMTRHSPAKKRLLETRAHVCRRFLANTRLCAPTCT